jgi:hypothetical protein
MSNLGYIEILGAEKNQAFYAIILQAAGDHFYGRQLIRNSRTATALVGLL